MSERAESAEDDAGELGPEAKVEAIEHLQNAITALVNDDLGGFSGHVGDSCKTVSEAGGVPYFLQDAGGLPVEEYGPSVALPGGHSIWVTLPGAGDSPEHDFAVNFDDHFHVYVDGDRKDEPTFTVKSDEFQSELRIDDSWGKFTSIERVDDGAETDSE